MIGPVEAMRIDKSWIQTLNQDQRFQLSATYLYLSKIAAEWYVKSPILYVEAFGVDRARIQSLPDVRRQNHIAEMYGRRQREWNKVSGNFDAFFGSIYGGAYTPRSFVESRAFDDYLSSREFHTGHSLVEGLNLALSIGGESFPAEHRFYVWAVRYFGMLRRSAYRAHGDALNRAYANWLVAAVRAEPAAKGAPEVLRAGVIFRSMSCARKLTYISPNLDEYSLIDGAMVRQLLALGPLVLPSPAEFK